MKYQSELIKEIVKTRGHKKSSLHYESECIESWIGEAKGAYPKLCDYESEWLSYISILDDTGGSEDPEPPIGEFPYVVLSDVTEATIDNVVPLAYKSAILKGNTLVNLTKNFKYQTGWSDVWGGVSKSTKRCCYQTENVKGKTKYFLKNFGESTQAYIRYYGNSDANILSNTGWLDLPTIITTPTNTEKISVTIRISDNNEDYTSPEQGNKNLVVEYQDGMENWDIPYFEGMQSVKMPVLTTSNEAGTKTNILTVNEPIELRGFGDVKDELNLMTGEVVKRVGEVMINGSEGWKTGGWYNQVESIGFEVKIKNDVKPTVIVKAFSDKILYNSSNSFQKDGEYFDMVGSGNGETWIRIRILRSKLSTEDAEGFKKWLSQNNLKILYELSVKPVKTVDLIIQDQDGNTLSIIKPIEGKMHLSTSSDTIKPLFSGEIPVEAITQNLASFIDLEMEE